jgi:5-methylcytosine-specific restriction endonuclease McrA
MASVLLLNADAQPLSLLPLSTISWQNAIKAYYQDKVTIVKNYDDKAIHSVNMTMPMPSIVMLKKYHRRPNYARFSRRNMYIRDNYHCQYCGSKFDAADLTIDHVVPRSLGGGTSWENCTTACFDCNTKKGSKLIRPLHSPIHPSWHQINNSRHFNMTVPDINWQEFIQWPDHLLIVNKEFAFEH